MTNRPMLFSSRAADAFTPATVLAFIASIMAPAEAAAQGLPVQNGPMFPVALWWIGAIILGLALVYGIMRNRNRTPAEKELTERAAKELQAREARDEKRG